MGFINRYTLFDPTLQVHACTSSCNWKRAITGDEAAAPPCSVRNGIRFELLDSCAHCRRVKRNICACVPSGSLCPTAFRIVVFLHQRRYCANLLQAKPALAQRVSLKARRQRDSGKEPQVQGSSEFSYTPSTGVRLFAESVPSVFTVHSEGLPAYKHTSAISELVSHSSICPSTTSLGDLLMANKQSLGYDAANAAAQCRRFDEPVVLHASREGIRRAVTRPVPRIPGVPDRQLQALQLRGKLDGLKSLSDSIRRLCNTTSLTQMNLQLLRMAQPSDADNIEVLGSSLLQLAERASALSDVLVEKPDSTAQE